VTGWLNGAMTTKQAQPPQRFNIAIENDLWSTVNR